MRGIYNYYNENYLSDEDLNQIELDEQMYYDEVVCSSNYKQEDYDYVADETKKSSQENAKTLSTVDECKREDAD